MERNKGGLQAREVARAACPRRAACCALEWLFLWPGLAMAWRGGRSRVAQTRGRTFGTCLARRGQLREAYRRLRPARRRRYRRCRHSHSALPPPPPAPRASRPAARRRAKHAHTHVDTITSLHSSKDGAGHEHGPDRDHRSRPIETTREDFDPSTQVRRTFCTARRTAASAACSSASAAAAACRGAGGPTRVCMGRMHTHTQARHVGDGTVQGSCSAPPPPAVAPAAPSDATGAMRRALYPTTPWPCAHDRK